MMETQQVVFQQFLENYQAKQFQAAIDTAAKLEHSVRLLGEDTAVQFFNTLGQCYLHLKNYAKAGASFNVLIKDYPTSHFGVDGLIAIAQAQGNWAQMLQFAEIFQRYYPNVWQGWHYEALAHQKLGNTAQEIAAYEKLAEKFPSKQSVGLENLIRIACDAKNWQNVVKWAGMLQQQFPEKWQGYWRQGEAYRHLKQTDLAMQQFDLLKQKFPNLHYGWEGYMNLAEDQQDWQQVAVLLEEMKQKFPKVWYCYWWKGQNHKRLQQWDWAVAEFVELQQKFPNNHQGFEGEIQVEHARKNWERLAEISAVYQQKFPDKWLGYWRQGEAYRHLKQTDLAMQQFDLLKQKFPNLHYGWEGYMNLAEDQQDWHQAVVLLEEMKQRFPKVWYCYWWKGQNHKRLEQWDWAVAEFVELQQKFPNNHHGFEGEIQVEQIRQNQARVAELAAVFKQKFPNQFSKLKLEL